MNRALAIVLVIVLQLQLGACGTTARLAGDSRQPAPLDPGQGTVEQMLPPNPYHENRQSVPRDAQRRFELALTFLDQPDPDAALAELQYLVEHFPQLSGPALNMALVYQRAGEIVQAERWFRQSIDSNPANLVAYNQYGIFLREQGRFAEAEQVYLSALSVWEPYAAIHRNIGVLYDLYMGDREQALRHFYRYQALTDADDRAVAGWIADLERQLTMLVQGG